MKSFSIRKATNPNARNAQASADMSDDTFKYDGRGGAANAQ